MNSKGSRGRKTCTKGNLGITRGRGGKESSGRGRGGRGRGGRGKVGKEMEKVN